MASAQTVTYVLVPGSFTTTAEHDRLIAYLEKDGHAVKPVELQTANDGTRMPPATFEDDVSHIRSNVLKILDDEKRNVILVLHSYSGLPGSAAMQGLAKADRAAAGQDTAVLGVVYIASFVPLLNQSVRDILGEGAGEWFLTGFPGDYFPPIAPERVPFIFNDLADEDEVARYYSGMVQHASDAFSGKTQYEPWKDMDCIQIIPEKDLIIPTPLQETMYEQTVKEGGKVRRVFLKGAGHCPNITQADAVAAEVLRLAGL